MTAAWIALVLIGVGLPLGAWWVGGRPVWSRSDERARRALAEERAWVARHSLSTADLSAVHEAVGRGRALGEARLRAAAVEMAQKQLTLWGGSRDVAQRTRWVLGALWLVLAVAIVSVSAVSGSWSWTSALLIVNGAAGLVPTLLVRRNLRRTIQVNNDRERG